MPDKGHVTTRYYVVLRLVCQPPARSQRARPRSNFLSRDDPGREPMTRLVLCGSNVRI